MAMRSVMERSVKRADAREVVALVRKGGAGG